MSRALALSVALAIIAFPAEHADKTAVTDAHYRVYRGDGTLASLDDVVEAAKTTTVTFLGEEHGNPVAHYLERELLKRLSGPDLVLALEMFERDVQHVLNEYLSGIITEEHLIASARASSRYKTDYRALIEYAKERGLPVIASNAPRRYVNRVSRLGKESLTSIPEQSRQSLAPLPYADPSPEYKARFARFVEEMKKQQHTNSKEAPVVKGRDKSAEPPRDPEKSLQAQTLWDATMAYSIAETLIRRPDARVLHVNGSFHTEHKLGIVDHLARYRPKTPTLVVTMLRHKGFPKWDAASMTDSGDFVIVTDPAVRSTSPPPAFKPHGNHQKHKD